jgi:hypothetical protein
MMSRGRRYNMRDLDKRPAAQRRDGSAEPSSSEGDRPTDGQEVADATFETMAALPRDVGWFLLVAGLVSELGVPGVPPFWIFGILILWPRAGAPLAARLQRHAPRLFAGSLRTIDRYARDLERRYPSG